MANPTKSSIVALLVLIIFMTSMTLIPSVKAAWDGTDFFDGFEGSFPDATWTATFGTPTQSSTEAFNDTYSVYINAKNEGLHATATGGQSDAYISAWFYIDEDDAEDGNNWMYLLGVFQSGGYYDGLYANKIDDYLSLTEQHVNSGVGWSVNSNITKLPSLEWFHLEYARIENDEVYVWLNGVSIFNSTDGVEPNKVTSTVRLGQAPAYDVYIKTGQNPATFYADDFRAQTTYYAPVIGAPPVGDWYITSSVGTGGTILPLGETAVINGTNQQFNITSQPYYFIDYYTVDGGAANYTYQNQTDIQYIFYTVVANHTIDFQFYTTDHYITATAGTGGTITPSGVVTVHDTADQNFTIAASSNYYIDTLTINGDPVEPDSTLGHFENFLNVTMNHTIAVTFTYVAPPTSTAIQSETEEYGTNHRVSGAPEQAMVIMDNGWTIYASQDPAHYKNGDFPYLRLGRISTDGVSAYTTTVNLGYDTGWVKTVGAGGDYFIEGLTVTPITSTTALIWGGVQRGTTEQVMPFAIIYNSAGGLGAMHSLGAMAAVASTGFSWMTGGAFEIGTDVYLFNAMEKSDAVRLFAFKWDEAEVELTIVANLDIGGGGNPVMLSGGFEDPDEEGVYYLGVTTGAAQTTSYYAFNTTGLTFELLATGGSYSSTLVDATGTKRIFLGGGKEYETANNGALYWTWAYVQNVADYTDYHVIQERIPFGMTPTSSVHPEDVSGAITNRTYVYDESLIHSTYRTAPLDAEISDYNLLQLWTLTSGTTSWERRTLLIPDWWEDNGLIIEQEVVDEYYYPIWGGLEGRTSERYAVGHPLAGRRAVITHKDIPTAAHISNTNFMTLEAFNVSAPEGFYNIGFEMTLDPDDSYYHVNQAYNWTMTVTNNSVPYVGHIFNVSMAKTGGGAAWSVNKTSDANGQFWFNDTCTLLVANWTLTITGDNPTGGVNTFTRTFYFIPEYTIDITIYDLAEAVFLNSTEDMRTNRNYNITAHIEDEFGVNYTSDISMEFRGALDSAETPVDGTATWGYWNTADDGLGEFEWYIYVSGQRASADQSHTFYNWHIIYANSSAGGSVSPSGWVFVREGSNQKFTFTGSPDYYVDTVYRGDPPGYAWYSVGSPASYTFTNINQSGAIMVTWDYSPDPAWVYIEDALNNLTDLLPALAIIITTAGVMYVASGEHLWGVIFGANLGAAVGLVGGATPPYLIVAMVLIDVAYLYYEGRV